MEANYKEKDVTYYTHTRDDLKKYIPSGINRALDIGCSNGNFGLMLKHFFNAKEVWGIEPFEEAALKASSKLDKVINQSVEAAVQTIQHEKFDCIFFNDVLEHLVEPGQVLKSVREFINPSGIVFASIPNILEFEGLFKILTNRDWKYELSGIMDKTHLRFFTRKSIVRMFNEAGYEIVLLEGINPTRTKKFRLFQFFFGKKAADFKYTQFVVIAKKTV